MTIKEAFATVTAVAAIYAGVEKLITSTPSYFASAIVVAGYISVMLLVRHYKKL